MSNPLSKTVEDTKNDRTEKESPELKDKLSEDELSKVSGGSLLESPTPTPPGFDAPISNG